MRIQVVILHLVLADNPLSAYRTHLSNLALVFQAVNAIGSGQLERLLYILSVNEDHLAYFLNAWVSILVRGCCAGLLFFLSHAATVSSLAT